MKRLLFILILFLMCFVIYNINLKDNKQYLFLGETLSFYDKKNNYLTYILEEKTLKYNNNYFGNNNSLTNIINNLSYNEEKTISGKKINIHRLLNTSDIVVISLGMKELYQLNSNYYYQINKIIDSINNVFNFISKYNSNSIYVLGFYNNKYNDDLISYANKKLKNITKQYNFKYVDMSKYLDNNNKYFVKDNSYLLNKEGNLKIYKIIVANLENN